MKLSERTIAFFRTYGPTVAIVAGGGALIGSIKMSRYGSTLPFGFFTGVALFALTAAFVAIILIVAMHWKTK